MASKVFGVDLQTLVNQEKTEIPKLVTHMIEFLTTREAYLEEGLFRIPGNNLKISELKKIIDKEGRVDLFKHRDVDSHTAGGILKLYLRELPEPIIIHRFYSTFLKVYTNPDPRVRTVNTKKLIKGLPKCNRDLLLCVLKFLNLVAEHESVNKMSSLNLAVIFAPNLIRGQNESLSQIMEDSNKVSGIVQLLIQEVDYITNDTEPQWFAQNGDDISRSKSGSLTSTLGQGSPPSTNGSAHSSTSSSLTTSFDHIYPLHDESELTDSISSTESNASAIMKAINAIAVESNGETYSTSTPRLSGSNDPQSLSGNTTEAPSPRKSDSPSPRKSIETPSPRRSLESPRKSNETDINPTAHTNPRSTTPPTSPRLFTLSDTAQSSVGEAHVNQDNTTPRDASTQPKSTTPRKGSSPTREATQTTPRETTTPRESTQTTPRETTPREHESPKHQTADDSPTANHAQEERHDIVARCATPEVPHESAAVSKPAKPRSRIKSLLSPLLKVHKSVTAPAQVHGEVDLGHHSEESDSESEAHEEIPPRASTPFYENEKREGGGKGALAPRVAEVATTGTRPRSGTREALTLSDSPEVSRKDKQEPVAAHHGDATLVRRRSESDTASALVLEKEEKAHNNTRQRSSTFLSKIGVSFRKSSVSIVRNGSEAAFQAPCIAVTNPEGALAADDVAITTSHHLEGDAHHDKHHPDPKYDKHDKHERHEKEKHEKHDKHDKHEKEKHEKHDNRLSSKSSEKHKHEKNEKNEKSEKNEKNTEKHDKEPKSGSNLDLRPRVEVSLDGSYFERFAVSKN